MLLNEAGHDALHIGDVGMSAAADETILLFGDQEDRVVFALDADFHLLLANSSHPPVRDPNPGGGFERHPNSQPWFSPSTRNGLKD